MAEKSGGYSVGNLEVSLTALGTSAADSIDLVIKRLNTMDSLIKSIGKNTALTQFEKVNKMQKGFTSPKSSKRSSGFSGLYAGFRALSNTAKRLFGFASGLVEKASDYLETLNLWQVAFRNNTEMADKFIQKMNSLYGISKNNLMNYQAIFKNMFSSLGGLEEATSSKLSEAFTKWALDFSSLFNVSIESAMSKFQAVLSGQVRPVRSVSGFDITERTLYNIYQGMGGTKTMRQLDILEKRLLSVYAIYQQMDKASALGDLGKTINQFANQSRITKEILSEIAQWAGTILKLFLDNNNVLIKLNAGLIVARDVVEGIARYMGFKEPNFLDDMLQSTEAENNAVDELQGKLLSFDRFESLNSADTSGNLAIDQTILDAIADYESKMGNVDNLAQKLAEQWEAALGFQRDSEGNLIQSDETIGGILDKVKGIGKGFLVMFNFIGLILSPLKTMFVILGELYITNEDFSKSVNTLMTNLGFAFSTLGNNFAKLIEGIMPALNFIIESFSNVINFLDELGVLKYVIVAITGAILGWKAAQLLLNIAMNANPVIAIISAVLILLPILINLVVKFKDEILGFLQTVNRGIAKAFNTLINNIIIEPINTIIELINNFVLGAVNWFTGLFGQAPISIPYIPHVNISGVGEFAQGGYPDRGTLFVAGEAGAEVVMSDSSGRTSVTNIVEMEEAVYRGTRRALSEVRFGGGHGDVYLDGRKVGVVTEGTSYSEGVRVGRQK